MSVCPAGEDQDLDYCMYIAGPEYSFSFMCKHANDNE